MKRIALLGFIIIGLPIIFTACCFCGGCDPSISHWTYSKIESKFVNQNTNETYHEGDTTYTDSIKTNILFTSEQLATISPPNMTSVYSAVACGKQEFEFHQKNKIQNFVFKLALDGDLQNADTISSNLINLKLKSQTFNWLTNRKVFMLNMQLVANRIDKLEVSFPSPHNSKYIQFVTWAIKENGDTLKAISPKVFCK